METTEPTVKEVTILSIDAWRNGPGWDWNNWFKVGKIDLATVVTLKTNRKILRYMRKEGYLSADSGVRSRSKMISIIWSSSLRVRASRSLLSPTVRHSKTSEEAGKRLPV